MKLANILLALALLLPLAFSIQAESGDTDLSGEVIGIAKIGIDHMQDASAQASEKAFVGSIESNKYHCSDCRWAEKIKPEHEIWFSSPQDAQSHGYVACKVCKPP